MKFSDHLIAVACEQETTKPLLQSIRNPANFLQALYLYAARTRQPISREGTDRMMDMLFSHPDMESLLDPQTATQFQNEFATLYLPTLTPAYQTFWNHIVLPVLPAWAQHQDIYQVLKNTEEPTNPESCCTETGF
jgi:hypothetical protein